MLRKFVNTKTVVKLVVVLAVVIFVFVGGYYYRNTRQFVIVGGLKVPKSKYSAEEYKQKFLKSLPLDSDIFQIAYNPSLSKNVIVDIYSTTLGGYYKDKQRAIDFIKASGINEICSIKPRFIPVDQKVWSQIKDTDIFASGCPTE